MNTANAMLTQMINRIFERLITSNNNNNNEMNSNELRRSKETLDKIDVDKLKQINKEGPETLSDLGKDAYMIIQDIYLLLNSEQSIWLLNVNNLNKLLSLEILRTILLKYTQIFLINPEMCFLLKERICPLLIKLLSPSTKLKPQQMSLITANSKDDIQLVIRLMRIVFILIKNYFELLITENEIFLSLLIKYLDFDRPQWQKILALEIFFKLFQDSQLIRLFLVNYDMKQHTEKILFTILQSISNLIVNLFIKNNPTTSTNQQHQQLSANSQTALFIYKDVIISLISLNNYYLDNWDKNDIPQIQDGYLLNISYLTIQEFIKNIECLIERKVKQEEKEKEEEGESTDKSCHLLIELNTNNLLFILNILLETCMDELITDNLLKLIKSLVNSCYLLKLLKERDLFVVLICKQALPLNYVSHVVNLKQLGNRLTNYLNDDDLDKHQVVALGTPLNNTTFNQSLSITFKNIICMKFILNMCLTHAKYLENGSSWFNLLNTLEHLSWTLNLKPVNGYYGLLEPHLNTLSSSIGPSQTITTAIQTDLQQICNLLSKLFELTKELNKKSLLEIVQCLIRLSNESIYIHTSTTSSADVCLFGISKLYEVIIANVNRIELIWSLITNHLIDLAKQQQLNIKLRESCVEIICSLIKQIFNNTNNQNNANNNISKKELLIPLQELTLIQQFNDVRQKQLECSLTIIRLQGTQLFDAWPLCLQIIGSINKDQSEILIRSAFQCIQLIVTDYLTLINANYLSLIIQVVSKFGFQEQDLNISLTAIVLLWNISDYMFHNNLKLVKELGIVKF